MSTLSVNQRLLLTFTDYIYISIRCEFKIACKLFVRLYAKKVTKVNFFREINFLMHARQIILQIIIKLFRIYILRQFIFNVIESPFALFGRF